MIASRNKSAVRGKPRNSNAVIQSCAKRRIGSAATHFFDRAESRDLVHFQLQLVHHKLIGVLDFNALGLQNCLRKIFGVKSVYSVGVAHDDTGYDMLVIRVW